MTQSSVAIFTSNEITTLIAGQWKSFSAQALHTACSTVSKQNDIGRAVSLPAATRKANG